MRARQLSCRTTEVVSQRRIQNCRRGAQRVEIAARGLERASNLIGRRLRARRLLQLVERVALCLQKPRALLRVHAVCGVAVCCALSPASA